MPVNPGEQLPPGFKMCDQQGGSRHTSTQQMGQLALPAPVSENPEASSSVQAPGAQQHQMVEKRDVQTSALVEEKHGVTPTTHINPLVPAHQECPEDKDARQRGTKDQLDVQSGASNANHEAADALAQVSQALERREEDKKMRRPAAAVQKRPAMKRPGAAPSLSKASSVQKKDPKKSEQNDKKGIYWRGNITQKERMKLMPEGCSTCRYRKGCTDSCWKKKHYWPV